MKNTIFILIKSFLILLISSYSWAHSETKPAQCPEVVGIKEMQDFRNDGSEYIRYSKTPVYTSQSDETFFHHFAIKKGYQKQHSPELTVSILNHKKNKIKSYKFSKWADHSEFKDLAYLKMNFQDFMKAALSGPFDVYINLNKSERDKISLNTVPYSAAIEIKRQDGKSLCKFEYQYGNTYHEH